MERNRLDLALPGVYYVRPAALPWRDAAVVQPACRININVTYKATT